jgi:uncharacterized membrane protein YbhN (UPF0104 family)
MLVPPICSRDVERVPRQRDAGHVRWPPVTERRWRMPRFDRRRLMPWLRGFGVAVALFVLGWTFRDLDLARVSRVIAGAGGTALLWALVPMGVALAIESCGWTWAFRRSGHPVPFVGIWRARVSSEALALTLPAGMLFCESMKPFLLARHCGLRAEASIAGMAMRKYLLLASQAVYISVFALLGAPFLERASSGIIGRSGLSGALLAVGVVVLIVAIASGVGLRDGAVAERARAALARLPLGAFGGKLERSRGRFTRTDGELRKFFGGNLLVATLPALPFLVSWVLEAVETYLILRLLGVELPFVAVAALEVALSFVRHVTFVLPAGLGVQDLGYVAFLRALGAADPLTMGAAFVLIKRAKECIWASVGYGLLALDLRATVAANAASADSAARMAASQPG